MARAKKQQRSFVNPNIDTKWFYDVLKDSNLSLRDYNRACKLAEGYASRLFRGMRKFDPADGQQFAMVTGADINEVMIRAGIDTSKLSGSRVAEVAGWVDNSRRVHFSGVKGARKVTLPPDMSGGAIALRYQTQGTQLDALNGAIIYCRPLGDIDADMVNRWCYVRIADGRHLIRIVKRGSNSRLFNLWNDVEELNADVEIKAASAVEWVRF